MAEIKERELTEEEKQAHSLRESLFVVNQFAAEYFQDILYNNIDGQRIGMTYLRGRGFRDDIIKKFQLGYSTASGMTSSRNSSSDTVQTVTMRWPRKLSARDTRKTSWSKPDSVTARMTAVYGTVSGDVSSSPYIPCRAKWWPSEGVC